MRRILTVLALTLSLSAIATACECDSGCPDGECDPDGYCRPCAEPLTEADSGP